MTDAASDVAAAVPLTLQQQWTCRRAWLPPSLHRTWCTLDVPAGLSEEDVSMAVTTLVARHEALRGGVDRAGGVVYPPAPERVGVTVTDDLRAWLRHEIDLPAGDLPWVRFGWCAHAGVLAVVVEEMAADCWSMAVLRAELVTLLAGDRPPPPPEIQYGDYAVWQRECLDEDVLATGIHHWVDTLALARRPAFPVLPTDAVLAAADRFVEGDAAEFAVTGPALERLRRNAVRDRVSAYMLAVAAVCVVVRDLCAEADVLIETGAANRDSADVDGIVGAFYAPLFLPVTASGTPGEVLATVRQTVLAAHEHVEAHPTAVLAAEPALAWLAEPSPDLLVRFQFVPSTDVSAQPWAEPLVVESGHVPADLQIIVHDTGDRIDVAFRTGRLLASVAPAKDLADRFRHALSEMDTAGEAVR